MHIHSEHEARSAYTLLHVCLTNSQINGEIGWLMWCEALKPCQVLLTNEQNENCTSYFCAL